MMAEAAAESYSCSQGSESDIVLVGSVSTKWWVQIQGDPLGAAEFYLG